MSNKADSDRSKRINRDTPQRTSCRHSSDPILPPAGGSIGSELCRQLVRCGVSRLILLERSESALFDIHSELAGETDCVPELLDITDSQRLSQVLNQYRPAAAGRY